MKKKIYFAGSIRGGRDDASLYADIINYIKKTDIVLTEHIGLENVLEREVGQSDEEIYLQDTNWLKECDLLIGECTTASLGVGYELAYAEAHNIPCYVFYRPADANLSAMIAGNSYFKVYSYRNKEEIYQLLDSILGEK